MADSPHIANRASPRTVIDTGRLWAGGVATAVVAALAGVVGFLIFRGVLGIPVLAPSEDGAWGDASTAVYALCAALAALVATGLVLVLILFTPAPYMFFGWIMGLAVVAGIVAPFMSHAEPDAKVATAVINLILGVAIGSLVASVARDAVRRATARARARFLDSPPEAI
jgi:hypothetical protein